MSSSQPNPQANLSDSGNYRRKRHRNVQQTHEVSTGHTSYLRNHWVDLASSLVSLLSVVALIFFVVVLEKPIAETAGIIGSIVTIVVAGLAALKTREVVLSLYRGLKWMALVVFSALILAGLYVSFTEMPKEAIPDGLSLPPLVRTGFLMCLFSLFLAVIHGAWKFKATRFAEARCTLINEFLADVEECLKHPSLPIEEKRRDILDLGLSTATNVLNLSPWNWLIAPFRKLFPSLSACAAYYLVPELDNEGGGYMEIKRAIPPRNMPGSASRLFQFLQQNHKPALLDRERFKREVEMARHYAQDNWRERFIANKKRHEFISATGWISAKGQTLFSNRSETCLAFDDNYLEKLCAEFSEDPKIVEWARIRSFAGTAIAHEDPKHADVLFVTGNSRYAFIPEAREIVETIGRILRLAIQRLDTEEQTCQKAG